MLQTTSPQRRFRLVLGLLILTTFIGCDQATKSLATKNLRGFEPKSYLSGTFRLEYALNPGGFLSLGGTLSPEFRQFFFVGFNACFLIGVTLFLMYRWNMKLSLFVAAVCILAGGIGNLIDRVVNQGLVTDFLVVGIGPLRSGVFNVADMGVTFGAIAVILLSGNEKASEKKPDSLIQS
ncbi:MAG: signal peptidase II [Planctomycetaceae bacterium]|nr:signal peptidase II [Planctomycetaceae bacterium]